VASEFDRPDTPIGVELHEEVDGAVQDACA
jgi:hypothetical protein